MFRIWIIRLIDDLVKTLDKDIAGKSKPGQAKVVARSANRKNWAKKKNEK